jgi:hypothetical protein
MVDIYANIAGVVFGFIAWWFFGSFTVKAVKHIYKNKTLPIDFVKRLYIAFVVIIVLFPFDFYINTLQLEVAFATKGLPLFENDIGFGVGMFSLAASVLLLFPLGVICQMSSKRGDVFDKRLILNIAVALLFLEILQFFEVSGQSSLPSYLFKLTGFCAGLVLGRVFSLTMLLETMLRLRLVFIIISPVFLYLALKLKGLDFDFASSLSSIMAVIKDTNFLPFRYYVDVGSAEALLSFLLNLVIFLPIGGLLAIHQISKGKQNEQSFSGLAWIGLFIATILEGVVLIWGLKRPDVTNILVAASAVPMGYYFFIMISNAVFQNAQD